MLDQPFIHLRVIVNAGSHDQVIAHGQVLNPRGDVHSGAEVIQALIQRKARVLLHSSLPEAAVCAAHLSPCPDISAEISAQLAAARNGFRIAVLPQGPLTIPYLPQPEANKST